MALVKTKLLLSPFIPSVLRAFRSQGLMPFLLASMLLALMPWWERSVSSYWLVDSPSALIANGEFLTSSMASLTSCCNSGSFARTLIPHLRCLSKLVTTYLLSAEISRMASSIMVSYYSSCFLRPVDRCPRRMVLTYAAVFLLWSAPLPASLPSSWPYMIWSIFIILCLVVVGCCSFLTTSASIEKQIGWNDHYRRCGLFLVLL